LPFACTFSDASSSALLSTCRESGRCIALVRHFGIVRGHAGQCITPCGHGLHRFNQVSSWLNSVYLAAQCCYSAGLRSCPTLAKLKG
jgi:hypothetical protein